MYIGIRIPWASVEDDKKTRVGKSACAQLFAISNMISFVADGQSCNSFLIEDPKNRISDMLLSHYSFLLFTIDPSFVDSSLGEVESS